MATILKAQAQLPKAAPGEKQLEAAKNAANVRFFNEELDTQRDYLDFIATSQFTPLDISIAMKNVTSADVAKELDSMKSQAPCMFVTGDILSFPSLRQLGYK